MLNILPEAFVIHLNNDLTEYGRESNPWKVFENYTFQIKTASLTSDSRRFYDM